MFVLFLSGRGSHLCLEGAGSRAPGSTPLPFLIVSAPPLPTLPRSEGQDQPALPRSLIRAFTPLTELLDTEYMNGEHSRGWYFAHVQDYLNLLILRMLEGTFSHDAVHSLSH